MLKLSFSINGWKEYSWQDFTELATEIGFKGIELHNAMESDLTEKDGPFHKYNSAATIRKLADEGITIPCVDISKDISAENTTENAAYIRKYIDFASSIKVPYVRVYASGTSDNAKQNVIDCLKEVVDYAEQKKVTVLIETVGMFADTLKLRDILMEFACDNLAALWDVYHTFCEQREDTETTITNLGAYIRHVHLKDSAEFDGEREYCLIGEGEVPVDIVINALSSAILLK